MYLQASGLSVYLGEQLRVLEGLPTWVIVLVISLLIATLTEIASNTAIANITLPILAALVSAIYQFECHTLKEFQSILAGSSFQADSMNINPLILMLPATLSASFAFMLPVATPPNAIVFSYGHIKVIDMVSVS